MWRDRRGGGLVASSFFFYKWNEIYSVNQFTENIHPTLNMAISSATLSCQLASLVIILGVFSTANANKDYDIPTMPDGYVFDPNLNVAFKVHTEKKTWSAAKATCESEGAILALVDNMEQIRYLANKKPFNSYAWIGMYRTTPTTPWSTVMGTQMNQIPWAPTKPAGPHNCMAIRGCNRGLSNENCNTALIFICEMARGTLIAQ